MGQEYGRHQILEWEFILNPIGMGIPLKFLSKLMTCNDCTLEINVPHIY